MFFRRGLIERWGRGTQVIVEECQRAGCREPTYGIKGGCFVVTFPVGAESGADSRAESGAESRSVLQALAAGPLSKAEIATRLGRPRVTGALNRTIRQLLADGTIAYTLPEKPNSRLQKYQLRLEQPGGEGS